MKVKRRCRIINARTNVERESRTARRRKRELYYSIGGRIGCSFRTRLTRERRESRYATPGGWTWNRVFQSTCGRGLKLSTDGRALVVASRRLARRREAAALPLPSWSSPVRRRADWGRPWRRASRRVTPPKRPFGPAFIRVCRSCADLAPSAGELLSVNALV